MRLLLTNDDGIDADGIARLERVARTLSEDVWIVAPADNRSSCGRAITQTRKVVCEQRGERRFAVHGTPGDCAIVALNGLLPGARPQLVLSGVNRGSNLGEDLALSGTVGACLQAWEQNVPGIALSQVLTNFDDKNTNWNSSHAYLKATLQRIVPMLFEHPGVLNVNFPPLDDPDALVGVVVAKTGRRLLPPTVTVETDTNGQRCFDYRSLRNKKSVAPDSDIDLAYRGFITITPLTLEMADAQRLCAWESRLCDCTRVDAKVTPYSSD